MVKKIPKLKKIYHLKTKLLNNKFGFKNKYKCKDGILFQK